jgi:class 3 adenylate cyclase
MERRLAAILAADVVGYSRLMGEDEEGTLATLRRTRELLDGLIADFDGRVFGGAGDSVMGEFSSPVQAVRFAIRFQEEIEEQNADLPAPRRMRFRIGINLGDVMVENDNLFGDGVNIAARIQALADPGGVCRLAGLAAGHTDTRGNRRLSGDRPPEPALQGGPAGRAGRRRRARHLRSDPRGYGGRLQDLGTSTCGGLFDLAPV